MGHVPRVENLGGCPDLGAALAVVQGPTDQTRGLVLADFTASPRLLTLGGGAPGQGAGALGMTVTSECVSLNRCPWAHGVVLAAVAGGSQGGHVG